MYCSTCGRAVTPGLSYCNHCGAKLNQGERVGRPAELRPESLVATISAVFILGLTIITMLMGMMKVILGLPVDQVLAFSLLPFILMLVLEGLFIRLLLQRTKAIEGTRSQELSKQQVTNQLDPAQPRELPENMPSVTENTTRAFDPIYTERK